MKGARRVAAPTTILMDAFKPVTAAANCNEFLGFKITYKAP